MQLDLAAFIAEFCVAFVLGVVMVPYARRLAFRVGAIDKPDKVRKFHARAMPRLGGIAIYVAFVLALAMPPAANAIMKALGSTRLAAPLLSQTLAAVWTDVAAIVVAGTLVLAVGIYDDIRGTRPIHKIAVQVAAGLVLHYGMGYATGVTYGGRIGIPFTGYGFSLAPALGPLVTVVWVLVCSNAINLIDGLDGLAGGVSLIALLTIFVFCLYMLAGFVDVGPDKDIYSMGLLCFLSAALAGAVAGFLIYNFPPAVVFLGDSGSLFLGLMIGAIALRGAFKSQLAFTLLVPVLAIGLPLVDTGLAVIRRWSKGLPFSVPDRYHIHHRLISMGFTPRQAVVILYAVSTIFGAVGLILISMTQTQTYKPVLIFTAVGVLVLTVIYLLSGSEFRDFAGKLRSDVLRRRVVRRHLIATYPYVQRMENAADVAELWETLREGLAEIGFEKVELDLASPREPARFAWEKEWAGTGRSEPSKSMWRGELALTDDGERLGTLRLEVDPNRHAFVPECLDIATDLAGCAAARIAALADAAAEESA